MAVARIDPGSGSQMRRQYHTTKAGDSSKEAPTDNYGPSGDRFLNFVRRSDCIPPSRNVKEFIMSAPLRRR